MGIDSISEFMSNQNSKGGKEATDSRRKDDTAPGIFKILGLPRLTNEFEIRGSCWIFLFFLGVPQLREGFFVMLGGL